MFGVGLPELAVILLVAVLVFGPDRLPEFAQQAGRLLRQARQLANSARDDLRSELGPEYADLELRDLDPRTIVRKHIMEAMEDADAEAAAEARPKRRAATLPSGAIPPFDSEAT
ncbi:sec-independent translocase [Nocardioides sp. GXZ039]|uniref:sec-independent translocase n=1 Tax=Nocardioides sp. GXZ039 TaxID=3136018 RepID=UPI0030F3E5E1